MESSSVPSNFRNDSVSFQFYIVILLLVDHQEGNAATELPWRKVHQLHNPEFVELSLATCTILRTFPGDIFHRVAIGVLDKFDTDPTRELSVVASVVAAVCNSASAFAISVGSHIFAETYVEYLGSGYKKRLVVYPFLGLRMTKGCLQMVASSVFGSLHPFSMTEVNWQED